MNKSLQKELRDNEKKIMELEREIQKSVCTTQHDNLVKIKEHSSRLKESSLRLTNLPNKENAITNSMKSIERKKGSIGHHQVKKTGRISASSTNLAKKLQIKNNLL